VERLFWSGCALLSDIRPIALCLDRVCKRAIEFLTTLSSNDRKTTDAKLTVMSFVSFGKEVDTAPLNAEILRRRDVFRLVLPRVDKSTRSLHLHICDDLSKLVRSRYGILEPDAEQSDRVAIDDVDCAFMPGLAFSRVGDRIGYGAGYYDRLLSSRSADVSTAWCALAFDLQIVDEAWEVSPNDVRVPRILTEERTLDFRSDSSLSKCLNEEQPR
jgi:5-formyltetrahydrofolate cyclo-ligase